MNTLAMVMIFAVIAALSNCIGGILATAKKTLSPGVLRVYTSLGAGFILAAAITEMVPESLVHGEMFAPLLILGGYLLILLCENTLVFHVHIEDPLHREEMVESFVGTTALIGLTVHSTLDGAIIASGFSVTEQLGLLMFLIVVIHKIPAGFTIASIQLSSGRSRRFALGAAVLLGVATIVGAVAVSLISGIAVFALPVAAGAILYVAASDLIPVLGEEKSVKTVGMIILGGFVFLLTHILLLKFGPA